MRMISFLSKKRVSASTDFGEHREKKEEPNADPTGSLGEYLIGKN